MTTIGIYDSGIGGLTVAKHILSRFEGYSVHYLADNLHHPFGSLEANALRKIISSGVARLRRRADIIVLACNTASTSTNEEGVFKLLPPVDFLDVDQNSTLLMATNCTIKNLGDVKILRADTPELATLVEIQASLSIKNGRLNMDKILPYLSRKLSKFSGVKNVVLGCSHYPYCKPQIQKILGDVNFFDGTKNLIKSLEKTLPKSSNSGGDITFEFTAKNEENKYKKILNELMNNREFDYI